MKGQHIVIKHLIFIYGLAVMLSLSHIFALIATLTCLSLLLMFRIPPIDSSIADEMLQAGKVSIIAHRGGALEAPENTIAAIRKAKENGADGVELDLSYTSDNVPVLLHDDTIDRTTDGTGKIDELPWSYVQTLNAAAKYSDKSSYANEKIPTLEEAAQVCLNLGLRMYIDCKADAAKTANVMADLYRKHPDLYKMALVCSFHPYVIYKVRRADPRIVTGLIHRPWYLSREGDGSWRQELPHWQRIPLTVADVIIDWAQQACLWFLIGNSVFSCGKDSCFRFLVRYFEAVGVKVVVWTVNDPVEKDFFTKSLGIDIITDWVSNPAPSQ